MRKVLITTLALVALSACAEQTREANAVAVYQQGDELKTCPVLVQEMNAIGQEIQRREGKSDLTVENAVENAKDPNGFKLPFSIGKIGKADQDELQALQQRYTNLQNIGYRKNCFR